MKIEDQSLGFTYEIWNYPAETLKTKCWGTNPYQRDMLRFYEIGQIENFVFESCTTPSFTFAEMLTNLKVRHLRFHSEMVDFINPVLFENLPYLTYLDLSKNLLKSMPSNFFDSITNITKFLIKENKLENLPEDLFVKLKLDLIDFNNNQLESLPEKIFERQFDLISLDLSKNKLASLPEHIFDDLKSLKNLELSDNKITFIFPKAFYDKMIQEEKTFDAFICFHPDDIEVVTELSKELESKDPFYTLCIHNCEMVPGNTGSTNNLLSMRESRKIIVIINVVNLYENRFSIECQAIYKKILEEYMSRLIIIIKGDLPDESSLNPCIKQLLRIKSHLKWKERWFWEKLRYELPHKKKKGPKTLTQPSTIVEEEV
ncbi:hypothetical protein LAZ67_5000944 [Cordylochernes scorpioides]|uniref:TIR domain-containing protein n=1 Tax=Cordylochernes scorpioides TaxID=51811 RepID=A0ABY6KK09_9ARAC|nr:hypothetical protein LAZ67_5000944 [Cordylochernes scorpioides]